MSDVPEIPCHIEYGHRSATAQLLPLLYPELKRLAAALVASESSGHTLQPAALVHEAYVRLVDVRKPQAWDSRKHFMAAASETMRRILIENARRRKSLKRGADWQRKNIDVNLLQAPQRKVALWELDAALDKLSGEKPKVAKLVELRYFDGLTLDQAAAVIGVSSRTADNYWAYAKSWLYQELVVPDHRLTTTSTQPIRAADSSRRFEPSCKIEIFW